MQWTPETFLIPSTEVFLAIVYVVFLTSDVIVHQFAVNK